MAEPETELVAEIDTLGRDECLQLLATVAVGRVGLLVDGRPEILPVNFALDVDVVVFRTAEGSVLNQAALSVVAFEVDRFDSSMHSGWSVLIQGAAQDIGTAIDPTSERLRLLTLVSWAPGTRPRWFRVLPERVTGRRVRVHPAAR